MYTSRANQLFFMEAHSIEWLSYRRLHHNGYQQFQQIEDDKLDLKTSKSPNFHPGTWDFKQLVPKYCATLGRYPHRWVSSQIATVILPNSESDTRHCPQINKSGKSWSDDPPLWLLVPARFQTLWEKDLSLFPPSADFSSSFSVSSPPVECIGSQLTMEDLSPTNQSSEKLSTWST